MIWLETAINGLMLGSLYALFGLGLALVFGVMKITNIAHGEFVIAGAYAAFGLGLLAPVPIWILVPLVAALGFVLGAGVQLGLVNRVMDGDPLRPLLLTFGLSVIIQNVLTATFGADARGLEAGWLATADVPLWTLHIGLLPLTCLGVALALFAGLQLLIGRTGFGRALRATADDPEMVALMGIDRTRILAVAMGLAAALAALAGILLALRSSVTPFSGSERLLIAFEVVVIGGLGSIWASLFGGLALGLVQAVGFQLDPASGPLYGHLLLLLVLLARPQGLSGRQRTR